jgi:hypothetical protein
MRARSLCILVRKQTAWINLSELGKYQIITGTPTYRQRTIITRSGRNSDNEHVWSSRDIQLSIPVPDLFSEAFLSFHQCLKGNSSIDLEKKKCLISSTFEM